MTTPYTYHLFWQNLDVHYYGVRFAKNCSPDDLWVTYFSSSKYVKNLCQNYGPPDIIEIRKTFVNKEAAILWEAAVLKRLGAKQSTKWINKHNGDGQFIPTGRPSGFSHTDETKLKMSKSHAGSNKSKWSAERKKKLSDTKKQALARLTPSERCEYVKRSMNNSSAWTTARREKISKALTGKTQSAESKIKMSKSKKDLISKLSDDERALKFGYNKGKTWRMVDGKRQWFVREDV